MFTKDSVKQFISYFFVGGMSAVVEWVMFFIFANALHIQYLISTGFAFVFSTTTNWFLGKTITFKGNNTYIGKRLKEIILVFVVSGIGLLFNLLLMYVFVDVLKFDTSVLKMLAKAMATGIVFIWNFLIRKFVIYK